MAESSDDENYCTILVTRGLKWHHNDYIFFVINLRDKQSWTFQHGFRTECERLPTFWMCRMEFEKVQDDGKPRIFFSLERIDSLNQPVKVEVTFLFTYLDLKTIGKEIMYGGEKIEHFFTPNLDRPDYRENYNERIGGTMGIKIASCHNDC